jgi:phosphoenolpyruvate-protein kinase (PTS system EI component)
MIIQGKIAKNPTRTDRHYVYLTNRLEVRDVTLLRNCAAIICEYMGACDHSSVLCRIWGKPVVQISRADSLFQDGEFVSIDSISKTVNQISSQPDAKTFGDEPCFPNLDHCQFQVSIADHADVRDANRVQFLSNRIKYFFIREELLWACAEKDPFSYLAHQGKQAFSEFLKAQLSAAINELLPSQSLNYRSLDWRVNEFSLDNGQVKEPDTQLGNHGIRRSLANGGELIIAELLALASLEHSDLQRVTFSLPFVTDESELLAVAKLVSEYCPNLKKLGVFVETPAAVSELQHILQSLMIQLVCVGTKDLTQTILACDRSNQDVRHLFSPRKRAVIHAIQNVLSCCEHSGTECAVFVANEDIHFFREAFPSCKLFSLYCDDLRRIGAEHENE